MDDEEGIRDIATKILEHLRCQVRVAADGNEAIALFRTAKSESMPFDLVIIDLTIKAGMGGLETFETLKTIDPEVRAVVSTGHIDDPVMKEYQKYGFIGTMPKPYRINEIKELLTEIVPGYTG